MNKDEEEIWAYDEPHQSGGNVHVTMTRQQAIRWMKNVYPVMNDEQAFHEWVIVHWAYRENYLTNEQLKSVMESDEDSYYGMEEEEDE